MTNFTIGDVVQLKSKSPKMTVTAVHLDYYKMTPGNFVSVSWFDEKGNINYGNFPFEAVEKL